MSYKIIPVIDPNFNRYDTIIQIIDELSTSRYFSFSSQDSYQINFLDNVYQILKIISKFYNRTRVKNYYLISKSKITFILEEIINYYIVKKKTSVLCDYLENMLYIEREIWNKNDFREIKKQLRQIPHNFVELGGGSNYQKDPLYINSLYDEPKFICDRLPRNNYEKYRFFLIFLDLYQNLVKKMGIC